MRLLNGIKNVVEEQNRSFSPNELWTIKHDIDFESERENIVRYVSENLDYPKLPILQLAESVPDKRYEQKLLGLESRISDPMYATCWMLALGNISSEAAFGAIKKYTETDLWNTAFVSLARIDLEKAMRLFDPVLDKRCELYLEQSSEKFYHDSGYSTLNLMMFEYGKRGGNPDELAKYLNVENSRAKRELVKDSLRRARGHLKLTGA